MLAYKSVIRIAVSGVVGLIIAIGYLIQPVAAMTPFEPGHTERGIVQEVLGRAIVDATRAQTAVEKAKAQEALGQFIVAAARVEMMAGAQNTVTDAGRGIVQELLGQAIVDTTRVQTAVEKTKAQEALGRIIMTAARVEMMAGAQKIPTVAAAYEKAPPYNELRGEVPGWPLGALGAFIFGAFIWCLGCKMEAEMPAAEVAEEKEEQEVPLRKAA